MTVAYIHGIGEMLRYLTELFDSGSEKTYPELTVHYRPRYTPSCGPLLPEQRRLAK